MQRAADELEFDLKDINDLYDKYAIVFGLWAFCLEILRISNPREQADVNAEQQSKELWDRVLSESVSKSAGGSVLAAAAEEVSKVGSRLYPFDTSFPAHHVARRLEEIAYGLWPTSASAGAHEDEFDTSTPMIISQALLKAANQDFPCAYRAYETLMSLRGIGGGEASVQHRPRLRYRMLRTAYEILVRLHCDHASMILSLDTHGRIEVLTRASTNHMNFVPHLYPPRPRGRMLPDKTSAGTNQPALSRMRAARASPR